MRRRNWGVTDDGTDPTSFFIAVNFVTLKPFWSGGPRCRQKGLISQIEQRLGVIPGAFNFSQAIRGTTSRGDVGREEKTPSGCTGAIQTLEAAGEAGSETVMKDVQGSGLGRAALAGPAQPGHRGQS